jgi:ArsR family transcriptional regulator, lead/cadmium/zinc/bismuth-responsive transcriptional repressor
MTLNEESATKLADIFRTLSDPNRVRIISALLEKEMNVGEIAAQIGPSESAVSHQLKGLRQMRLVRARKDGRQVFYSLDDDHVAQVFRMVLEHMMHN